MAFIVVVAVMIGSLWLYFKLFGKKCACEEGK